MEFSGKSVYSLVHCLLAYKKKIDNDIDFLKGCKLGGKMVSIFCLRCYKKVEASLGPNGAVSEIHTKGSLDITLYFGIKNVLGQLVWPS